MVYSFEQPYFCSSYRLEGMLICFQTNEGGIPKSVLPQKRQQCSKPLEQLRFLFFF